MASRSDEGKSKERLPVGGGYLFTPPENTVDSFSSGPTDDKQSSINEWRAGVRHTLPPIVHTPPESPETKSLPSIASAATYSVHDSPLFPDLPRTERALSQTPLFEDSASQPPSPTQVAPIQRLSVTEPTVTPAQRARSDIFPDNLNIRTGEDAFRYWKARVAEADRMRAWQLPKPQRSASWNLDGESRRQLHSLSRSAAISKPRTTTRTATKPKATVATSPVKTSPPKRRTPKARTLSDFVDSAFPVKEPSAKHKRAPPSKKIEGENVNWTELPDYAPPLSDLDSNPKVLKVTWHGHALPLHDDPDKSYMHEQEVQVASALRLSCGTYLTNKRKIFQARLQALKDGKNFTKTAAQSACKIDVNKASQLWEAFDRVGWFSPEWYKQYL